MTWANTFLMKANSISFIPMGFVVIRVKYLFRSPTPFPVASEGKLNFCRSTKSEAGSDLKIKWSLGMERRTSKGLPAVWTWAWIYFMNDDVFMNCELVEDVEWAISTQRVSDIRRNSTKRNRQRATREFSVSFFRVYFFACTLRSSLIHSTLAARS